MDLYQTIRKKIEDAGYYENNAKIVSKAEYQVILNELIAIYSTNRLKRLIYNYCLHCNEQECKRDYPPTNLKKYEEMNLKNYKETKKIIEDALKEYSSKKGQ